MSTEPDDDSRANGLVQACALLVSAGAFYAALRMGHQGGQVFLGLAPDPYARAVWVGVTIGIPVALGGAVIAVLAAQDRPWDLLRVAATALLVGNLAIPLAWGVLWLLRQS